MSLDKTLEETFFGECFAIWSVLRLSYRYLLAFCFFDGLGCSSGQILSSSVVLWTFVGRPSTHVYPSGKLILRIWKRCAPIHFCESKTSLIIPIIVQRRFGGVIDTCFHASPRQRFSWSGEGCFIWDVQHCSMYFVMAIYEVTTHAPKKTIIPDEKASSSFPCSGLPLAAL